MEHWRTYRILIGFLIIGLSTSCVKEELDENIIDNGDLVIPTLSPVSQYETSFQNHEWNDGWYSHTDVNSTGLQAMGSLTYFDYGNDSDMDVFVQIEEPAPQYFNTWIIEN